MPTQISQPSTTENCPNLFSHLALETINVSKVYFAFAETATSVNHNGKIKQYVYRYKALGENKQVWRECRQSFGLHCVSCKWNMNGTVAAHINSLSGTFLVTDLRTLMCSAVFLFCLLLLSPLMLLVCFISHMYYCKLTYSTPPQWSLALLRSSRETPVREEEEEHAAVSPRRHGHSSSHFAIYALHPLSWQCVCLSLTHTHSLTHTQTHTQCHTKSQDSFSQAKTAAKLNTCGCFWLTTDQVVLTTITCANYSTRTAKTYKN